ncbi:hypothetical protein KKH43_00600 [Patescibacteria group bacterium]|nr:hypothetical protein [Patescibacteria group bacterium]
MSKRKSLVEQLLEPLPEGVVEEVFLREECSCQDSKKRIVCERIAEDFGTHIVVFVDGNAVLKIPITSELHKRVHEVLLAGEYPHARLVCWHGTRNNCDQNRWFIGVKSFYPPIISWSILRFFSNTLSCL